jgi:hypothetical protein
MTLNPRTTPGASVTPTENGWRLQIPAGPAGTYRLAQLDNYRSRFPVNASTTLSLRCRVSPPLPPPIFAQSNSASGENEAGRKWGERGGLPGTWGFGFWNDPFTVSLGLQGTARRLPVLPSAAWFFHASNENHISLQNHLPGNGFLAQCFSSPKIPSLLLAPALLVLPFMFSKTFAKWIRAFAGKIIHEDAKRLDVDVTQWHEYRLKWSPSHVEFNLDGAPLFETETSPRGPLGLVIWIDNQYAAFTPDGKIRAGTQENPAPAWMEIADLEVCRQPMNGK